MHIVAGPMRVVDSGSVTTFNATPLVLIPTGGPGVTLIFSNDEDGAEPSVDASTSSEGWVLRCRNFSGSTGRGTAEPIYLGDLGDRGWFLHFRAFLYGKTRDHTVHYTFYAGDPCGVPAPVER